MVNLYYSGYHIVWVLNSMSYHLDSLGCGFCSESKQLVIIKGKFSHFIWTHLYKNYLNYENNVFTKIKFYKIILIKGMKIYINIYINWILWKDGLSAMLVYGWCLVRFLAALEYYFFIYFMFFFLHCLFMLTVFTK